MKNSSALNWLFFTWLGFTISFIGAVIIQSANGKYGDDWGIPLQWALAMPAPCMTLVTAAWRNQGKPKWQGSPVSMSNLLLAFAMSILVWLGAFGIFVWEATGARRMYEIIPITIAGFAFLQVIIIASVSKIAFAGR